MMTTCVAKSTCSISKINETQYESHVPHLLQKQFKKKKKDEKIYGLGSFGSIFFFFLEMLKNEEFLKV